MAERGRPRSFDRVYRLASGDGTVLGQGLRGASLSDLIAAMGINSPSLYAAFGCKEELFREAVALYSATEGGRIWDCHRRPHHRARAAIETMLSRKRGGSSHAPASRRGCLVVLGAIHADDGNEAVHRELREKRAENVESAQSAPRIAVWPRANCRRVSNCRAVADVLCDRPARHIDPGSRRRFAQNPSRRRRLCHGRVERSRRFPPRRPARPRLEWTLTPTRLPYADRAGFGVAPSTLVAGGPGPLGLPRGPPGPLTLLAVNTVPSDANSGWMLEDVGVDGRDIHMDGRIRFRNRGPRAERR